MQRKIGFAMAWLVGSVAVAAPLKVRVVGAGDDRKAYLMRRWDSWQVKPEDASKVFGDVTVSLAGANGAKLAAAGRKALLENGMHLGVAGVASDPKSDGDIVMTISGLSPGAHTIATYHNEVRDKIKTAYKISVDGKTVAEKFEPTRDVTDDYFVASTYLNVVAVAGKSVEIRFEPTDKSQSCIINGFEIDESNPAQKAMKPIPANDDEHIDPKSSLQWTAPPSAKTHLLYFGTDAEAVAKADQKSPDFKGALHETKYALPELDHMKTYYWRVDEVNANDSTPVKGEEWRLRSRFMAFPTAEGYGEYALGGRGGRVIEVTTLDDYDKDEAVIPGSYRAAIEAEGPRTVVFRVSGLIQLKRECPIKNGYITIAGQTAPGDGICLSNYSAGMATNDAIVRYIRVRVGDKSHRAMDGLGLGYSDDSIIDHCSISWAMDEGTSSRGGHNITFQWNIISEMLQHGFHYNASDRTKLETHAFAGSISGDIGSYHHNLLAHCTDRNWSLAGGLDQAGKYAGRLDIRNNVVFNWTARTTDGGVKDLNYVGNYYKPLKGQKCVDWLLMLDPINDGWGAERVFMSGNVMEGYNYDRDNWTAYNQNRNEKRSRDDLIKLVRVNQPIYPSFVKDESAHDAYKRVVAGAGATLPKRDVIDTRIAEEVRDNKTHYIGHKANSWTKNDKNSPNVPGIIDTQDDVHDADDSPVKPWPNYKTYDVPVDSDHDGIPDDWEKAHGLNPNDPSDANGDYNGDGYTNLEKYLNSLTGEYDAKVSRK